MADQDESRKRARSPSPTSDVEPSTQGSLVPDEKPAGQAAAQVPVKAEPIPKKAMRASGTGGDGPSSSAGAGGGGSSDGPAGIGAFFASLVAAHTHFIVLVDDLDPDIVSASMLKDLSASHGGFMRMLIRKYERFKRT